MDPEVQLGSTPEELVENFASSLTRFQRVWPSRVRDWRPRSRPFRPRALWTPNRSLCRGLGCVTPRWTCDERPVSGPSTSAR